MKKYLVVGILISISLYLINQYFIIPKIKINRLTSKTYDFALDWGGGGELNKDQLSHLLSLGKQIDYE